MSWKRLPFAACCLGLLLTGPAAAQTIFTEVTEQIGVIMNRARSHIFGDLDNDGWPDIFRSSDPRVQLLHNEGNGRFADWTSAIQGDIPVETKGGGAIFGDYDNDGDLDLFVPIGSFWSEQRQRNLLLRNDRGTFVEVGIEAGLTDVQPTDNAIWLDYDRDGYLDLYTGNMGCCPDDPAVRNKLYRNNGDGTFADMTARAGLDIPLHSKGGGSNGGMAAGDFNDDGWPDLYMGVAGEPNRLFFNDGKGGFADATTREIGDPGGAYHLGIGDIDNDLDLDIFQPSDATGIEDAANRSLLLLNLGKGQFLDVTEGLGLGPLAEKPQTEGAGMADVDSDGDLDLLIALPPQLYLNSGDGTFVEQSAERIRPGENTPPIVFGDYDLDGFLDGLPYVFPGLYRNNGNGNHALRVELVGIKSNRSGIGSRVIATAGDLHQMRELLGGVGYNQDELVVHFGLGQRTQVDRLEIRWPSGQVDVLTDIPADQKIRVIEGRTDYHRVEPTRWQQTPPETLVAGATAHLSLAIQPALFEPGAQITSVSADLSGLGGPETVPLHANSDGTYSLEPLPLNIAGPNGFRTLSVIIDQQTSLGSYWVQLSKSILVLPAGDLPLLAEGLAPGWTAEADNTVAMLDLEQGAQVHTGKKAVALQGTTAAAQKGWRLTLQGPALGTLEGFTALGLAIHLGETPQAAEAVFKITIGSGTPFDLTPRLDLGRRGWQEIQVPLNELGVRQPLTKLVLRGTLAGTIYLDDLRLVAATPPPPTVVEEERTASLPQSFALSQNFPNPFNSETVIRFALPTSAEVELAVFNLAGQRVVRLAEGVREGGNYTVRWDGRDGNGRELASGVYLYRLRAGEKVEMRKLLLLR